MERLEDLSIIGALNTNEIPSSPKEYHKALEAYTTLGKQSDAEEYERRYDFGIALQEGRVSGIGSD